MPIHHLTAILLGLSLSGTILYLVRRDHLQLRRAVFWLALALGVLTLGFFPRISDWLAVRLEIAYAPTLVLLLGQAILTVKLLLIDMANTRIEQDLRRLNQRLALYELESRLPLALPEGVADDAAPTADPESMLQAVNAKPEPRL